jgi:hypothetical protein
MNALEAQLAQLVAQADAAPVVDRIGLLGALVAAEERVRLSIRAGAPVAEPRDTARPIAERYLTPAEAAAVAQVPVKRLYEWARGRRWASRPTRRCLRIAEGSFRAWLSARAS